MHGTHDLFKKGMTVVDLVSLFKSFLLSPLGRCIILLTPHTQGYAPGSWTDVRHLILPPHTSFLYIPSRLFKNPQVAVAFTRPNGRVLGVDIIPALPPKGASTIQGNFEDERVQQLIKRFLADPDRGRMQEPSSLLPNNRGYFEMERHDEPTIKGQVQGGPRRWSKQWIEQHAKGSVDVLLSDMSEPWEQVSGFWMNSLTMPHRMMNTSGIRVKDHFGSMVCVP